MNRQTVAQALVTALIAKRNCMRRSDNIAMMERWIVRIEELADLLPSGSGFDNDTQFIEDESGETRLVFSTAFHHMNDGGYYAGWSEHKIVVVPTFEGFDIRVTGRDKNGIKEYIAETINDILSSDAPQFSLKEAA